MDPIKLELEDYCCYEKAEINFGDFSSASVIGRVEKNERKSNGSGKSTLFSAIRYVLFNRFDASSLDRCIRRGKNKNKVSFEFKSSVDSIIYRIERFRDKKSGNDVRLFKKNNDYWEDISQRTPSQTESEISKILKINYDIFTNSILFSQSDLYGIASLTPGKRKQALKSVLQLGLYNKFEKVAKKKLDDLNKEAEKTKIVLSTIGDPDKDIETLNKQIIELDQVISERQLEVKNKKSLLKIEEDNLSKLTNKFDTYAKHIAEINANKILLKNEILKLSNYVDDYNSKIILIEKSGKEIANNINKITAEIENLSNKKTRSADDIRTDISIITKCYLDKSVELKIKLSELEKLLIPLPNDAQCDKCRSILTEEHLNNCRTDINEKVKLVNDNINTLKKELSDIKHSELSLNKELTDVSNKNDLISNKSNTLLLLQKDIDNKRLMFKEYFSTLEDNKVKLKEKNLKLDEVNGTNIFDIDELNKQISKIKSVVEVLEKNINNNIDAISNFSNTKSVILHRLEDKNKDMMKISSLNKDLAILKNKLNINEKVVEAFGSAGIPALITHTILDDFQVEANRLLSNLFPGLQLHFSVVKDRADGDKEDTLDINYILNGYDDLEYAELSGAQKLIASLSLKLGLAAVINKRLGIEIKLLLIDEVDQSLDDERLEIFEDAIKKLKADYKILIITHNKELKDKFSHSILVDQDENFVSSAKVVSQW